MRYVFFKLLPAILFSFLLLTTTSELIGLSVLRYDIYVEGLIANVSVVLEVDEGFYTVPTAGSVIGLVSLNNTEVAVGVSAEGLIIYSPKNNTVIEINYTSVIGEIRENVILLNITLPYNYTLILNESLLPINIEGDVAGLNLVNGKIAIFMNGPGIIEVAEIPIEKTSVTPAMIFPKELVLVIGFSVILVVVLLTIYVKRRKTKLLEFLDERDKLILRALQEKGELTATELVSITKIPKSALYRRLKRLMKLGYIEQVKLGTKTLYKVKGRKTWT